MKLYDNDLFNDIVLPEGIDHDTVVNTILSESALNTPMYPEHDLFKMMIQNFFRKYYNNFDRYNRAMNEEYTPNDNYRKTDEKKIKDNVKNHKFLNGHQLDYYEDHEIREDQRMALTLILGRIQTDSRISNSILKSISSLIIAIMILIVTALSILFSWADRCLL